MDATEENLEPIFSDVKEQVLEEVVIKSKMAIFCFVVSLFELSVTFFTHRRVFLQIVNILQNRVILASSFRDLEIKLISLKLVELTQKSML